MTVTVAATGEKAFGRLWAILPARLRGIAGSNIWWLVVGSFAILTILIGLFSIHTMSAAGERREAERWHMHTLEVLQVGEEFRASTFAILRGERGYLLTDNVSFLEPYTTGRSAAYRLIGRLEQLVKDNPGQLRNAADVRAALDSFSRVIAGNVALALRGASDEAIAIVRTGRGKQQFDRLQASIDRVEAEERRLLIDSRGALAATAVRDERSAMPPPRSSSFFLASPRWRPCRQSGRSEGLTG